MSPEVEVAERNLATVPPRFMTDKLRATVIHAAESAAVRRQHAEKLQEARDRSRAAIASGDVAGAVLSGSEAAGLEQLASLLPSTDLDAAVVAEALENARELVRIAAQRVQSPPAVSYSLELAAWRSLSGLGEHITGDPPVCLASDLAAQRALDGLEATRGAISGSIAAINHGQGDILGLLAAAGSVIDQLGEHARRVAEVGAVVESANASRKAAGLTWRPPDSYSSTEVRALQAMEA